MKNSMTKMTLPCPILLNRPEYKIKILMVKCVKYDTNKFPFSDVAKT